MHGHTQSKGKGDTPHPRLSMQHCPDLGEYLLQHHGLLQRKVEHITTEAMLVGGIPVQAQVG